MFLSDMKKVISNRPRNRPCNYRKAKMSKMTNVLSVVCVVIFICGCETFRVADNDGYTPEPEPVMQSAVPEKGLRATTRDDATVSGMHRELTGSTCSARNEEKKKERTRPSLVDFADADNEIRPTRGSVYNHDEGVLRVLQVIHEELDDGPALTYVLAYKDLFDIVTFKGMLIGIINDREYVTNERIVKGEYRYIGTHTYETSRVDDGVEKKGTNTIRLFVEVGCEYDKLLQQVGKK